MSKTRVASKTSKTTSAWWLASNLRSIHLANKCQVNHKLRKLELPLHDVKLDGPGKKAELPQHKPGSPIANCWLPTTSQLHFLALHKLEQFKTQLSKSCAAAIGVDIWAIGQITLLARLVVLAPCLCNFESGLRAMSKTRVASKTSKTTSAWWLAPNLRSIPLANKCQVNHKLRKSELPLLHDRKLDGPGKKAELPQFNTNTNRLLQTGGYLQLRSFTLHKSMAVAGCRVLG